MLPWVQFEPRAQGCNVPDRVSKPSGSSDAAVPALNGILPSSQRVVLVFGAWGLVGLVRPSRSQGKQAWVSGLGACARHITCKQTRGLFLPKDLIWRPDWKVLCFFEV